MSLVPGLERLCRTVVDLDTPAGYHGEEPCQGKAPDRCGTVLQYTLKYTYLGRLVGIPTVYLPTER